MQCHYCDRDAAVAVEKDLVKVSLCEEHFRERVEELADEIEDAEWIDRLEEELE